MSDSQKDNSQNAKAAMWPAPFRGSQPVNARVVIPGSKSVTNRALILAAQATSLFPILRDVQLLRAYRGFRPYAPDHLPVIGEDATVKGLWHSAGHEGAGIGLAPGSAALITDAILGRESFMDGSAFSPARFEKVSL